MIAIDTSSLIAYLSAELGPDVDAVDDAFAAGTAVLPPAVLAEILADPKLPAAIEVDLRRLPVLGITAGYWERTGVLRRAVLKQGKRARLGDALIAQSCLDYRTPLITRDEDFRNFQRVAPLKIL